ncbi:MAG: hypothetical protein F6K30_23840 [Cyanothece sp. SIO2G6]|nr:hypothetical protein [Cyanothece sp. SIO2G6]
MNFRPRLTTVLATTLGLTAAIAITSGFQAVQAQNMGSQRQFITQNHSDEVGVDGDGRKQRGHRHQRHRGPRFCENGGNGDRFEQMDAFLTSNLELSETQQDNWTAVLDTFDSLDIEAACASEDREALREVGEQMRDPLHTFRDSLSDEQKEEIRSFMRQQRDRHRNELDARDEN